MSAVYLLAGMLAMAPTTPLTRGAPQCARTRTSIPVMLANKNATQTSKDSVQDTGSKNEQRPPRNRLRNGLGFGSLLLAAGGGARTALRKPRAVPVVVVHGVLSSALHMEEVADWAHAALGSSTYVRCLEVGNGEVDSITRPMEWQARANTLAHTVVALPSPTYPASPSTRFASTPRAAG